MTDQPLDTRRIDVHTGRMDTNGRILGGAARVIPWHAMTDEQRAEHLYMAHRTANDANTSAVIHFTPTELHGLDHLINCANGSYVPHTHDKPVP